MSAEWRERYGPWAIVSGASSGIGRAFATELARRGLKLILVARRVPLLEALRDELPTECLVVGLDLSRAEACAELEATIEEREVGLLIANAGTGTPGVFPTRELEGERSLVQLNCVTPMEMVARWLPPMRERGRGGIVLVSSAMAFQGVPFMAHYSATKAYLLTLGEALFHECLPHGVHVIALAPGATDTPGKDLYDVDYEKLPVDFSTPEFVVESALEALGSASFVVPGVRNRFFACIGGGLWTRNWVQRLMHRIGQKVLPESYTQPRE